MGRMRLAESVLHLVPGRTLPPELHAAAPGDTVVFLHGKPSGPLPNCPLLVLEPKAEEEEGLPYEGLLDLIFACDSVVTW